MNREITEQVYLLGQRRSLVAILTRSCAIASNRNPAVVILNTGIVHRVGHHRMYVALSRQLARIGFNVLRFDLSGIGDSEPRTEGLSPLDSSLADIQEVLDWLEQERGTSQVVLIGLCSGADHAILHSHGDPRVVALVLMDPSIPTTARFYAQYILQRATRLRSYVSVAIGRSSLVRLWIRDILHGRKECADMRPSSLENLRFHDYLKQSYRNVINNGVQILAVFTGDTLRQTYREQMLDAFPDIVFGDRLKLEFFEGTDHVFTSQADRARLFEIILAWICSLNGSMDVRPPASEGNSLSPASSAS